MIESAKLEIGGSKIDEVYGSWMNIWNELSRNNSNDRAHDKMVGNTVELTSAGVKAKTDLYVPLPFFFCRNVGLALPLIALQYHDVKITLKFRDATSCMNVKGGAHQLFLTLLMLNYFVILYTLIVKKEKDLLKLNMNIYSNNYNLLVLNPFQLLQTNTD